jgi:galactokinase
MEELDNLRAAFESHYGRSPAWIVRAPGRVNLIGEHTDYNGGFVLPMAIEREALLAAAPTEEGRIELRSTAAADAATIELASPVRRAAPGHWSNYPRGVVAGALERGMPLSGLEILIDSTVPPGGGLSSSAALAVATATVLEASAHHPLEPLDKVRLCQQAEHRFAGVPCGIMDPYVATFARRNKLLLLDCEACRAEPIEFSDAEVSVLIAATNVKHSLAHSEYALRRRQCEATAQKLRARSLRAVSERDLERSASQLDTVSLKRARHVVSEIARTRQAAAAISGRRWSEAGRLMYHSHESLRYDFEVSSPELDRIVEISSTIGEGGGVFGARMTGGGFGGCAVLLVRTAEAARIMQRLSTEYRERFTVAPSLFLSQAAAGACVLQHPL